MSMTMKMPEEFLLQLSKLADRTDEILPRVLEAGGEVVLTEARARLRAVVGHGTKYPSRSKGDLANALGLSPPKQDKNGEWNIRVGFAEPHPDSKSNAMLASVLEYGKLGQPPKPFMKPAKIASRAACIAAMKRKLEDEICGL
jgi:hypothetical protein